MLLKADVALREQSNSKKSLDRVLQEFKLNSTLKNKSWTGFEMMQTMDKLAKTSIFTEIYNQCINKNLREYELTQDIISGFDWQGLVRLLSVVYNAHGCIMVFHPRFY